MGASKGHEVGNPSLDLTAQFEFRQVRVIQPHVVGPVLHLAKMIDRVEERAHDISQMNVVALAVALEDDDCPIMYGMPDRVLSGGPSHVG